MEGLDGKWIQVDDTKCPEKDTSPATLGLTNMAGKVLIYSLVVDEKQAENRLVSFPHLCAAIYCRCVYDGCWWYRCWCLPHLRRDCVQEAPRPQGERTRTGEDCCG